MFGIFKIEKNLLQPIKICTLDSRILAYFLKGLTHDFGQTTALFAFRRLGKHHLKIMFGDHFDRKKSFLTFKNLHFRQSHFCVFFFSHDYRHDFFKYLFLGKNDLLALDFRQSHFFYYFSKGLTHDYTLTAVTALTPLQPLTDYKNNKSKSRKNRIFPKGLVHGFGQKLAIFPYF